MAQYNHRNISTKTKMVAIASQYNPFNPMKNQKLNKLGFQKKAALNYG